MESIQAKRKKNKKKLIIFSSLGMISVIGTTLTYFTTSDEFVNSFKSGKYQTTIKEDFVSPDNWTPGDTVDKKITVTNTGDIPIAVRASYTEKWINANNEELPLEDENGARFAVINFNSGWTKDNDGYYYYGSKANKTKLEPLNISSSFINSVTFNGNTNIELSKTISDDGKTIVYESTGNSYDDAKYVLTITIDTIQYSSNNIW